MIRAGIIGITGYTGEELLRILSKHKENLDIDALKELLWEEEPSYDFSHFWEPLFSSKE